MPDVTRREIYQPLHEGQIRTLSLSASNEATFNRATLHIETLATAAEYLAISYVWGDETDRMVIELNRKPWSITRNAYEVLRALASPEHDGQQSARMPQHQKVWLDAICINQEDEAEKNAQIRIMQDIYGQASHTLVRLGTPTNLRDARLVVGFLRSLLDLGPSEQFAKDKQLVTRFWSDQNWNLVCDMVMQPWHHRRWIIQEAVLSVEPWILYGDQVMLWTDFADAVERCAILYSAKVLSLRDRPGRPPRTMNIVPVLTMTGLRSRRADQGRPIQLLHLLNFFRRNACKVPQDRIFALLGLCSEAERRANLPESGLNLRQVLTRFAIQHVRLHNNLDVLCLATEASRVEQRNEAYWIRDVLVHARTEGMNEPTHLPNLPTWCPNVTSHHAFWMFGHNATEYRDYPYPYFSASRDTEPKILDLDAVASTGVMLVSGLEVDEIVDIESQTPLAVPQQDDPRCQIFQRMFAMALRYCNASFSSEQAMLTSFYRTLTAGGRRAGTRDFVSDRYLRHFMATFFSNSALGGRLRGISNEELPAHASDWYIDPASHTRYGPDETPDIGRFQLCHARFACTKHGRMALVPPYTAVGDRVCVLFGCSSPILLEPLSEQYKDIQCYHNRSEVFIDGFMHGEAIDAWQEGRIREKTFAIR